MTQASLIISLPQMVDLALGSPEVGAVNFNILNAVLQVIINQLKLTECTVDFRGPEHERVHALISTAKPGVSLHVTEYEVAADQEHRKRNSSVYEAENFDAEGAQYSKETPKTPKQLIDKNTKKLVVVEPKLNDEIDNIPRIKIAVTEESYKQLETDITDLKGKMSEIMDLPNNATLIDAVRSSTSENKTKAVSDMWQILSLSKRVDATEAGVDKLASMLEDLVRDISGGDGGGGAGAGAGADAGGTVGQKSSKDDARISRGSIFGDIANRLTAIEQKMEDIIANRRPSADRGGDKEDTSDEDEAVRATVKNLESELAAMTKAMKGHNLADVFKELDEMKEKLLDPEAEQATMDKMTDMEDTIAEFSDRFNNLDETYSKQIDALQMELQQLETDFNELLERVNTTSSGNDTAAVGSVSELFNKLIKLQEELEQVSKTANRLTEEAEEKQLIIDALIEQMEVLKTTKANREDLEDALADKADNQHMNRKVSHDQFDAACDDLTKSIEDTVAKLSQQETMWQTTLEEIQGTIGGKLDKMEFDPLRDFVNKKIKSLQQRLKALLAMKAEQEAAGTKSRILKNVNCISCDKDVVMYKQNQFPTMPAPAAMPCNRSMRPYITYELDAVRKQQKSLPGGTNLNHLESALHETKPVKERVIPEKEKRKQDRIGHACNRYCGGSHTTTTASQRVTHIGHFLNQWGPQAVPLEEASIVGTNGQMYKAREGGEPTPRKAETVINAVYIQTDEPREFVQRMSDSIEATGLSKLSNKDRKLTTIKSAIRTPSTMQKSGTRVDKEKTPEKEQDITDAELPVGDISPDDDTKSHPKSGISLSARKSSKKSGLISSSSEKRVSIAPKGDSSRASVKRASQQSVKKTSVSEDKMSKSQVAGETAEGGEAPLEASPSGTAAVGEPGPAPEEAASEA